MIQFVWVKAHVGIRGNERAYELAQSAITDDMIEEEKIPISKTQIQKAVSEGMQNA